MRVKIIQIYKIKILLNFVNKKNLEGTDLNQITGKKRKATNERHKIVVDRNMTLFFF